MANRTEVSTKRARDAKRTRSRLSPSLDQAGLPAAAAAATTAAAAATAGLTFLSFAHADVTSVEHGTIERLDAGLSFLGGAHFNEAEATRLARFTVRDDVYVFDGAATLGKGFAERLVGRVPGEVADEESSTH